MHASSRSLKDSGLGSRILIEKMIGDAAYETSSLVKELQVNDKWRNIYIYTFIKIIVVLKTGKINTE